MDGGNDAGLRVVEQQGSAVGRMDHQGHGRKRRDEGVDLFKRRHGIRVGNDRYVDRMGLAGYNHPFGRNAKMHGKRFARGGYVGRVIARIVAAVEAVVGIVGARASPQSRECCDAGPGIEADGLNHCLSGRRRRQGARPRRHNPSRYPIRLRRQIPRRAPHPSPTDPAR